MKLWLLTRVDDVGWDEYDAKVVLAPTEFEARDIANFRTGDEGKMWAHITKVECVEISLDGKPRELLGSFRSG